MLQELDLMGNATSNIDVYVCALGDAAELFSVEVAERLRDKLPHLKVMNHCGGGNFKKQMKRADASGAAITLIIGDSEAETNQVTVKAMREQKDQQSMSIEQLIATLSNKQ
jgi:histidyl-tRNA synthetase